MKPYQIKAIMVLVEDRYYKISRERQKLQSEQIEELKKHPSFKKLQNKKTALRGKLMELEKEINKLERGYGEIARATYPLPVYPMMYEGGMSKIEATLALHDVKDFDVEAFITKVFKGEV